jgi:Ser/Thr protein kinase RdoA (MazF antagonist)
VAFELASFAATRIPEALAPVRARDGSLAFVHQRRVVSLFPFVEGAMLDRTSERERDSAAQLLARLHRVLPSWPAARPRPTTQGPAAYPRAPRVEPPGLDDPRLDAQVSRILRDAPTVPAHGEFYRGNVRCVDGRITAVFDWDDARYLSLEYELAWSVWEFAQSDTDATLDIRRATRFLDVYASADGPVTLGDRSFVIPLIRQGLRTEVRNAAVLAELALAYDPEYIARERTAFGRLANVDL